VVKGHGQIHIFDVLTGAGTNAASRTEVPARTAHSSRPERVHSLQDDAIMTVNVNPDSGPTKGLGISAPRDAGNPGGKGHLHDS
jgi:hypothetical protein